jgi:hypothetical protein
MPSLDSTQVILGFVFALAAFFITVHRQRKLTHTETGLFIGAFFGGYNIPVAIYLCCYYFMDDPALAQTKLAIVAKYIPAAGLALLFAAVVSLWSIIKLAWTKPEEQT